MKINRDNYEAFFLDYIEGKLNSSDMELLRKFLEEHPDLKAELNDFEPVTFVPEKNIFTGKDLIKKKIGDIKEITNSNFDELCIAKIEGNLDKKTEALLFSYLQQHPEKAKEYDAYQKTVLKPDLSITFDSKRRIKHYQINRSTVLRTAISIAASALLFLMVYNYFSETPENESLSLNSNKSNIQTQGEVTIESKTVNKQPNNTPKALSNKQEKTEETVLVDRKKNIQPEEERNAVMLFKLQPVDLPELEPVLITDIKRTEVIKVRQILKENLASVNETDKENIQKKKLDLWTLAQFGADGINKLTGLNIVLSKSEDKNNRKRVEIEAGLLTFYSSSEK